MKIKALLGGVLFRSTYSRGVLEAKQRLQTYTPPRTKTQAPSTQAVLDRDSSKDKEHFNRPQIEANLYNDLGEPDVNERSFKGRLDLVSLQSASGLRLKGHYNVLGQSPLSGSTPDVKARAVEAFMSKRGVTLTDAQKILIHRYYEIMKYPDTDPTQEELAIIAKFHELVDRDALLVGENE
jgi:hypothetical protein